MKLTMRKVLSVVLSLSILVASVTIYNTTVKAALKGTEYETKILEPSKNLALKKETTVFPGCWEGNTSSLNDGTVDGGHAALGKGIGQQSEAYVIINLGEYYDASSIDEILIQYANTQDNATVNTRSYQIQYSANNVDFNTVVDKQSVTTEDFDENNCIIDDVSGQEGVVKFVKIYYPQVATYGIQINEIAVLADNAQTGTLPSCENPAAVNIASNDYNEITYSIVAGENQEDFLYNVYLDDSQQVGVGVSAGEEYTLTDIAAGSHTIKVISLHDGAVSEGLTSAPVEVKDLSEEATGTKNVASTLNNAKSKIISVSSFYEGHSLDTAKVAIDGSVKTGEGTSVALRTKSNTQPVEIVVDLGANYKTSQFERVLVGYSNSRTYAANTTVSFSMDNDEYIEVANKEDYSCKKDGAGTADMNMIPLNKIGDYGKDGVRYIKIVLSKGANGYGYVINEIGVTLNVDVSSAEIIEDVEVPHYDKEAVEQYKSQGTLPEQEGSVFAGWYKDAALTEPYDGSDEAGAYAKFIDEKVLEVCAQITEGADSIRFVSTTDGLDYSGLGFHIEANYKGKSANKDVTLNSVFEKLTSNGAQTTFEKFSTTQSKYFFAYAITGMESSQESTWTVTPFWTTEDGTKVSGTQKTFTISAEGTLS